jgi:hypothetical protein
MALARTEEADREIAGERKDFMTIFKLIREVG